MVKNLCNKYHSGSVGFCDSYLGKHSCTIYVVWVCGYVREGGISYNNIPLFFDCNTKCVHWYRHEYYTYNPELLLMSTQTTVSLAVHICIHNTNCIILVHILCTLYWLDLYYLDNLCLVSYIYDSIALSNIFYCVVCTLKFRRGTF